MPTSEPGFVDAQLYLGLRVQLLVHWPGLRCYWICSCCDWPAVVAASSNISDGQQLFRFYGSWLLLSFVEVMIATLCVRLLFTTNRLEKNIKTLSV